jgi:hypothetical protein
MTDQQINKLYSTVARESWRAVNDAADEFNAANGDDCADVAPYLYVFADGSWTIDYPDYISTTNGCISAVMVYHVNGPAGAMTPLCQSLIEYLLWVLTPKEGTRWKN